MQWESYQKLSYTEKAAFFKTEKVQFKHTLHTYLSQNLNSLLYDIDASIVDTIIGDMFFHLKGVLYNLYILAIPMFNRHTSENMFNLVNKFLNTICLNWHAKLIGVGSNEENSMTGHFRGVVTHLEQEAVFKLYRTWCGLHQLNHTYEKLFDGEVLTILNTFIAHLRQQANLIADMQATCPKLSNLWVVMGTVCK